MITVKHKAAPLWSGLKVMPVPGLPAEDSATFCFKWRQSLKVGLTQQLGIAEREVAQLNCDGQITHSDTRVCPHFMPSCTVSFKDEIVPFYRNSFLPDTFFCFFMTSSF
jgi:hypothetical protein